MTDSRIKELIDEYHDSFKVKYQRTPMIGGKEAKLAQSLWKWADQNNIDCGRIYAALNSYFSKDGFEADTSHSFEVFYKKINSYLEKPKDAAIVERAKEMFGMTQSTLKDIETVQTFEDQALLDAMSKLWQPDEMGCLAWCKAQRFTQNLEGMKDQDSKIYKNWIRSGKIARMYFGNELLSKCWKETTPAPVQKKKLSELIQEAKRIEDNLKNNINIVDNVVNDSKLKG